MLRSKGVPIIRVNKIGVTIHNENTCKALNLSKSHKFVLHRKNTKQR